MISRFSLLWFDGAVKNIVSLIKGHDMKKLIITALLTFASATVVAQSIEAPGRVFYKMPNGEIVKREVALKIPARGQGDVVLIGQQELVADKFFNKEIAGRTVFYVVFTDFPGAESGQKSVFRGTYTRGTNKAIYYGDVFIVSPEHMPESDEDMHVMMSQNHNAKYVAGFYFSVDIDQ